MISRLLLLSIAALPLPAETGEDAWLRYARLAASPAGMPATLSVLGESEVLASARDEMLRGVRGLTGKTLRVETDVPHDAAFVLGTVDRLRAAHIADFAVHGDGYRIETVHRGTAVYTVIAGANERGVLYGAFALLRRMSLGQPVRGLSVQETPAVAERWVNQWDNLDGSIERGYGGRSMFWDAGHVRQDLSRATAYARLLASVGIGACAVNNVNANPLVLSPAMAPEIARIAKAMRPWGVRVAISVDFGSPKSVGGLDTFDPLDPKVVRWWREAANNLYREVPDLAGFVLKADSEGRVGPSTYGRSHADAANVVARALGPHNGLLFYRGFVYDHHMDWRNPKNDRARAAYDNFKPLDGAFDSNAIVQIKNGPIDFQVREPASPLFDALTKTSEGLELQITQEYLGQGRHVVFLAPQWKAMPLPHRVTAWSGVSNAGLDANWYGSDLSQANLYAFGRLAWAPALTSEEIAAEWTRQTLGVFASVEKMLLESWRAYENYTGPLGLQTLTDIVGNHYGVAVEASERNGWGQWHDADERGAGKDRTVATGTGYIGQYPAKLASTYESLSTCPDELLLFMHHVPYTHVLHSGKTVIQSIYDSHYEGAAAASRFLDDWKPLRGRIDDARYNAVLAQLTYQAMRAEVWRDAVNDWFARTSGIADAHGRVGHHAGRTEAEAMKLAGYAPMDVTPWEAASGGKAVSCPVSRCSASFVYRGDAGWHTIRVQYFDQNNGVAHFRLAVGAQIVEEWAAADHVPTRKIDGSSSTRRTVAGLYLKPGDEVRVDGMPEGGETAALDYVEVIR